MNLKEIFNKAENGVLDYDQFQAACKEEGIKLADLSSGDYVSKKKYEDDLVAKDSQISTLNDTIVKRDTDLQNLKNQLTEAGNDVEKLNQLSTDLSALQNKYDDDVRNYQQQLQKQAYEFAVKEYANTKQFTSNAARRDFINSMIAKELKMDGDKILGADDFVSSYSMDNEDAFYREPDIEPEVNDFEESLPQFVGQTPGSEVPDEGFQFNFTGVRQHD